MADQPPMHTCMPSFPAKRTRVSMSRLHTRAMCGHLHRDSRESQCHGCPGHRAPVGLIHTDLVVLVQAAVGDSGAVRYFLSTETFLFSLPGVGGREYCHRELWRWGGRCGVLSSLTLQSLVQATERTTSVCSSPQSAPR